MLNFKHKTINSLQIRIKKKKPLKKVLFTLLRKNMANETGGIGIEDMWWEIREDANKVTEEAVRRVQDNQKKAQQVAQQIQDDKDLNDKFAQFLIFLLRAINNEKLIKTLYEAFFTTKNPKTQLTYIRKNINTIVIVGMFAPFYPEKIQEFQLDDFFKTLPYFTETNTATGYIEYLKSLSKKHHDNIPLEKEALLDFLGEILIEYHLINTKQMNSQEKQDLKESLRKTLYSK